MTALIKSAIREALTRVQRLRDATASLDGCVSLDAIHDALKALDRGMDETLAGLTVDEIGGLEEAIDHLVDSASSVSGHYAAAEERPAYDPHAEAKRDDLWRAA